MTVQVTDMTPLMPEGETGEKLQDIVLTVIQKSAALGNLQNSITRRSIHELLRIVNSYYSNLIEGHNTHPYDIVRAMQRNYDSEPAKRNLQVESVAHITVQRDMEQRLQKEPELNIAGGE